MERLVGYGTALAERTPFEEGDVLFLHSVSGRNPVTIELAMEAQKKRRDDDWLNKFGIF